MTDDMRTLLKQAIEQMHPLPKQVLEQMRDAVAIEEGIAREIFKRPKPGPARSSREPKTLIASFTANSESELERQLHVHRSVIGKKARGNKRIGRAELYADLVAHFMLLKHRGVTLPRNKSLSKKACEFGLGEILRRHGSTDLSDSLILKSGTARNQIAAKMDRLFTRVAAEVENTPALITG